MRVCMVAYTFYDPDNRVRRYAETLVKRGDQVDAIVLRQEGQEPYAVIKGIHVYRIQRRSIDERSPIQYLGKLLLFFLRSAWFLTLRHMRARYDLIHVHSVPDFQVFSTLIPRLLGARVILDIHDIVPEFYASKFKVNERSLAFRLLLFMERLSAAYSNHVIIANHLWHTKLCQRSVRPEKCTAIINYPDPAIFSRRPRSRTVNGDFVMCYPGTLNWHQGLDIAIRAMALLRDRAPNVKFLIIGDGPDREKLAAMVKQYRLEGRVIMRGLVPLEQVAETMACVDLGVVPKRKDSFGNEAFSTKIMEFMAMGVPVIASNTRIDQYYFSEKLVQFFESDNAEDLAAKILEMVRDAAKRSAFCARGMEFVQQNNWDVKKGEYLDLVDRLTGPSRRSHRKAALPRDARQRSDQSGERALPAICMKAADIFSAYYRCSAHLDGLVPPAELNGPRGYYRFGRDTVCYGRLSGGGVTGSPGKASADAMEAIQADGPAIRLPFDAGEVIDNLRRERYAAGFSAGRPALPEIVRQAYYLMRPVLPVSVRRYLQRRHFRGWDQLRFPAWPVDSTVERVHRRLLALALQVHGATEIPFIWFWPDGLSSCAVMTHDVETSAGLNACSRLMDIDDAYGVKSAFEFVPEQRYALPAAFVENVRERGFEINIHDLNHDGHLFANRDEFLRRAERINRYARLYGAKGFRSAVMYRNVEWYGDLEFSYDMSIPNVAHLEPQRGGCCTVMPYFIGDILELPATMAEDYTLFHMLHDYSLGLWKRQLEMVMDEHGLATFIVHPDYLIPRRATDAYTALLAHLVELRSSGRLWIARPGEVDTWWRQRSHMQLVCEDGQWRIEGPGSERARIAHAALAGDSVSYTPA